jgi:hypothetical protein
MRMLPWKDMKLRVLLIVFAGMFASGSALAAVREIDLGVLKPGDAVGLFGQFQLGVQSTDIYEFDFVGSPEAVNNVVSVSAISMRSARTPVGAHGFDITMELLTSYGAPISTIHTGDAVRFSANLGSVVPSASRHNLFNRFYELTVTGTPDPGTENPSCKSWPCLLPPVEVASYGGSLAVVPEPSMAVLLIGGFLSIAFFSRRRLS